MRWPLLLALCAGTLAAEAQSASSGKVDRLAVLPIILEGPNGEASLSSVINDVSIAAAYRLGLKLISNEEMFASASDLGIKVRDCGSDSGCIAERLRRFDARYGLVVVVNLAIAPPLLSLQLLDTDERRLVSSALGALEADEKNVSEAIQRRARKMFEDAGYVEAGRIVVEAQPGRARLSLSTGQAPEDGASNIFSVAPGRYEVRGEADGYVSGSVEAVAISGKETRVALVLEEETSLVGSPWFWGAIGAAVAGGTVAAIVLAQPSSRCVCIVIDGKGCGCAP